MHKHRPLINLVLTALVVVFASVFLLGQKASAQSLFDIPAVAEKKFTISGLLDKKSEVDSIKSLVSVKVITLAEKKEETSHLIDQKASLAQTVASLKEHVSTLDDMFVKINRYAPDSAGNTYAWGNCTAYAKSMRPDASNSWGNANTWYYTARAQGWNVGTKAKKGAIATTTDGSLGHVAFVEGVSLDGKTVRISEMNYTGLNQISSRTVYYTEFKYIYELN